MTQRVLKAPKGAKAINPKYTLTLTEKELNLLRLSLMNTAVSVLGENETAWKQSIMLVNKLDAMKAGNVL